MKTIKHIFLILLMGCFTKTVLAQCTGDTPNGDIETVTASITPPGIMSNNDWINDNVPFWNVSHGSPDILHDGFNNTIFMIATDITTGEGVYLEESIAAAPTAYLLTYDVFLYGDPSDSKEFRVDIYDMAFTPNDDETDITLPTPGVQNISTLNWSVTGVWITVTEYFESTGPSNQVWFRPLKTGTADPSIAQCEIDNVCIQRYTGSDPCEMSPNFLTETDRCDRKFTNNSVVPGGPDFQILKTTWDFGDGTSGEGNSVNHFYGNSGTYTVCMTVWATNGTECCVRRTCRSIIVTRVCSPCLRMQLTEIESTPGAGGTVNFGITNISPDLIGLYGYKWDFGDSNSATGSNPEHTYSEPGIYSVCLTVYYYDLAEGECCSYQVCTAVEVTF